MPNKVRIREQLQRNAVALISLVIAISSLGYNTWRNEVSEHNRNQRLISMEVLRNAGELQQVVYHRHWEMDAEDKGNPLTGWALVLTIKDLSQVLDGDVPASATQLWKVWDEDWQGLGPDRDSYDRIIAALGEVRKDTHALLQSLD
ncbi:MAG: hypothetical protein KJO27_06630 [Gammaproteobacteria bacterium]|nr:hypothetical protein [Gammaproteobacteria bacterium]MBT8110383.1 hypothetical protein [Gammaproteobacteria bacterium]